MADVFGQGDFGVRFDWGPTGARELQADVAVVVDVLSFSTSATIAVERGMQVFPFRWNDGRAADFAAEQDAVLAVGRLESRKAGSVAAPSLSPAGLLSCEAEPRIVLPSPNGSTIASCLGEMGSKVVIGCLRNATAVAGQLAFELSEGRSVAVIAAGERWGSDDSLRPALEDQLGAGAILSVLASSAYGDRLSIEATSTATLFEVHRDRLLETLHRSVSGRELAEKGFAADVDAAAACDVSQAVPVLIKGSFCRSGR